MLEGKHVLVVDDNLDIIVALSDFLELNGCKVISATTGKEAIELVKNEKIEIAILDVRLPDINGVTLLDIIKKENPTIAVIMMTGYSSHKDIIDAMKKGASDFLLKPFEYDNLIMVMIRALRERSLLIEKESLFKNLEDKKKIELLNRELQSKIKELTTMYNISNQFNTLNIYDDVYDKMVNIAYDVIGASLCRFYIYDSSSGEPILFKEKRDANEDLAEDKIFFTGELSEWIRNPKRYFLKDDIMVLPIMIKGELIGFLTVKKKRNGLEVISTHQDSDLFFLKLIGEKASSQIENRILYESLFDNVFKTHMSLITAINKRDSYTENHCKRVNDMALSLAEKVGLNNIEKDILRVVAPVHDLGKIGVPDEILLKPGKLTDVEYEIMKNHSILGQEILSQFEILSRESVIIRNHHERFDGRGYPDGISGEAIPACARIIAICDTFDAMTTNRPYRRAVSIEDALKEIQMCSGSQFDPIMVEAFVKMILNGNHGNK
ncbi:MAG TPA: response regulator [Syntrophorhabdaceae bacterium]|nr:response regulator [Syntrophorhabdaceae bacterium]HPC66258.1 response regulator [Syntrophorhabdaceae bacterium]HQE80939.1 response regulator [Syntrophorhabdaceae bacterium]HQH42187.1 response regulator [Syntrophorhabdaceae bacterium]HQK45357.1 response regulator [Syntrophorhabdaceae bacterium]